MKPKNGLQKYQKILQAWMKTKSEQVMWNKHSIKFWKGKKNFKKFQAHNKIYINLNICYGDNTT
jgi:hypothetical protein